MPPPKDMVAVQEPQVLSEIRAAEKKKKPVGHTKGSFMSVASKRPSRFSLSSKKSFTESP